MTEGKNEVDNVSILQYLSARPVECTVFLICSFISAYFVIELNIGANILIGNADQSNMANLARNIAEGNGAVVDNVWLMLDGGLPGSNVTHAEPYWSVYVAYMIAPFFKMFGASRLTLILPALLINIIIIGIVAWVIDKITPKNKVPTILGIVLASFSIPMLNAINGFSDIYLTLFILLTGIFLGYAVSLKRGVLFILAGVLAGVAVGIKPSGLLLLGVWPVYFVLAKARMTIFRHFIIFVFGMACGLTPYVIYNQIHYDTSLSPGLALAGKASTIRDAIIAEQGEELANHSSGENKWGHAHRKGFYDPESKPIKKELSSVIQLDKRISWFKDFIKKSFIWGMLIPFWLLPFIVLGIYETYRRFNTMSDSKEKPADIFLVFCILMLISGFVLAIRVSFEVRYWNYMVPLAIVLASVGVVRLPKIIPIFLVTLGLFTGVHYLINHEGLKKSSPAYTKAIEILPENTNVFTTSPWQFAFHTRHPSVKLPYTDNSKVIIKTAKRYDIQYIAIVDKDTKHSYYTPLLTGQTFDYLELIYRDENLILYQFKH
jgi:4-amino-4-deoxy-L-arabinose transferase-like glycosyltransferase